MPIYEYRCQSCEHKLEAIQKMSDDPLTECPECGQTALKKLVSAAAFRLKGGGWYETDFKSGSKKNVLESDGKSDAAGKGAKDKETVKSGSTETGKSNSGKADSGKSEGKPSSSKKGSSDSTAGAV